MSRLRRTSSTPGEVGIKHAQRAILDRSVDDETGYIWGALAHATAPTATCSRTRRTVRRRVPAASRALVDLAAQRLGGSTGDRDDPLANFFFGGFGNNYVDNGDASATARSSACRVSRSTRSAAGPSSNPCSNGTCHRCDSSRRARQGSTCLGAFCAVCDGAVHGLRGQHCPRYRLQRRFSVDVQMHVMHRLPMMLSFGYARGFGDGGGDEEEFMVSFKVL